jgi:phosphoribosylaminoimidazole-succinocarboxamide synthase
MTRLLYEGKAKKIFDTENPSEVLIYFKDDATAFNGEKKGQIDSKGLLNNAISSMFFRLLEDRGVPTHFVRTVDDRSMLAKRLSIIPLEVVVRNVTAGSLAKRLGWPEGKALSRPILELYYKDDSLGDPLINRYHVDALGAASPEELDRLSELALKTNVILASYLLERKVRLVDFKLEFGRADGRIYLGDEISPDTCRFWDADTGEKLDKDRFRRDLGGVEEAYREMYRRLKGQ